MLSGLIFNLFFQCINNLISMLVGRQYVKMSIFCYKYVTTYNNIIQYHIKLNLFQWCQQMLFIDNFPCILKKKTF